MAEYKTSRLNRQSDAKLANSGVRERTSLPPTRRSRAVERVARLQAVSAALGAAIVLEDVADVILSLGADAVGAHEGLVLRAVDNGRALETMLESRVAPGYVEEGARLTGSGADFVGGHYRFAIDASNPFCEAVRLRTPVWLQSSAEIRARYPLFAPLLESVGFKALVCLPLISRDEIIGGLRFSFAEERAFQEEERMFLVAFAQQCALALDRAQLYEDAIEARDGAERASRVRDECLSIVAHDLGTPMSAIGVWAAHMMDSAPAGDDGEEIRLGASKIQEGVRQMAWLLHDLRDVASIDSGHFKIEKQERDAEAIVTGTVQTFAPLCAERSLSIAGKAAALRVRCDPNRVQQVLGNLIANAIKYTPRGGNITVLATPFEGGVRFSVQDTGPGIPLEARKLVFDRYWRGKERNRTEGVGLGLFIAKGIIEAHGGAIWVESVVGRGSTFYFTLPLATDP